MEYKMKNPCDFVKFEREGDKAIPYCTYGSCRNSYFSCEREIKVRIGAAAHPCPFMWLCPHEGQSIPIAPEEPENV